MPLYVGVCETNITPPPDVWMGGYAGRGQALGVHDELYARAVVFDNGHTRAALVAADLIALPEQMVKAVREQIANALDIPMGAVMLHCAHTHGGPYVYPYRGMGQEDEAYNALLIRKLRGAARQALDTLEPAHLTYGEASTQIGVNRRQTDKHGKVILGCDYGGPVSSLVQTLCINGSDGRTFALLFSHACHPTSLGSDNRHITADWPGAAAAHLKARFAKEAGETGMASDALPVFLQSCCGDINPIRRGSWEAMERNGRMVAEAAHTARWNAHGRLGEELGFAEIGVSLPLLPPPPKEELERQIAHYSAQEASLHEELLPEELSEAGEGEQERIARMLIRGKRDWAQDAHRIALNPRCDFQQAFTIQKLVLGGVTLLGFPAEMFTAYQQAITASHSAPVFCLSYTNGCYGYLSTDAEHARGGYEVDEAYKYYGTLNFAPGCEALILQAAQTLLNET